MHEGLLLMILSVLSSIFSLLVAAEPSKQNSVIDEERVQVIRVVDGDTIVVGLEGGKEERVRLIGIDAPELQHGKQKEECFARESRVQLEHAVLNREVRLEVDTTQDAMDRYGRLLRYVVIDDVRVNLQLVKDGAAYEYTYRDPYQYQDAFISAQDEAAREGRGLWSAETCDGKK